MKLCSVSLIQRDVITSLGERSNGSTKSHGEINNRDTLNHSGSVCFGDDLMSWGSHSAAEIKTLRPLGLLESPRYSERHGGSPVGTKTAA